MLNLVGNYEEVIKNCKVFNESVDNHEELMKKLSLFRHWYYIEELNKFAPSKFVGYQNITAEEYILETRSEDGYMDGRDTVPRLRKWFKLIPEDENEKYYKQLKEFISVYDKKPNKLGKLYYRK